MSRMGPPDSVPSASDEGADHGRLPDLDVQPGSQIPEGLPAIPMEHFGGQLPDELADEADDHIPEFFLA